jgi:hypothetical protein
MTQGPNTSTAIQKPLPIQQSPRIRFKSGGGSRKTASIPKATKDDGKSEEKAEKKATNKHIDVVEKVMTPSEDDRGIVEATLGLDRGLKHTATAKSAEEHAPAEGKALPKSCGDLEQSVVSKVAEKRTAQYAKRNDRTKVYSTGLAKDTESAMSEAPKKNVSQSTSASSSEDANSETSKKLSNEKPVKVRPGRLGARRVGEAGVAKRLTAADKKKQ